MESEEVASELVDYEDCEEYYPLSDFEPIKPLPGYSCNQFIHLKGPKSPLESEIHPILLHSGKCAVNIDAHSVNSVLLSSMQQVISTARIKSSRVGSIQMSF